MRFKASLDKTAIVLTVLVTIVFATIIGGQYTVIANVGRAVPLYTTVGCLLVYGLAFAFRPAGYVVTADEVIISRPLLNVHIKRADIRRVAALPASGLSASIRLFGVGGLFGYYGKYTNFALGRTTWYATRRDTPVLIETVDNKKYILTPDEPASFVEALAA
ncbi:MAG: PH domain-containing protein [Janthinobacterium lividum]